MFSSVKLPPTKAIVDFVLFRVSVSRCSPESGPLTIISWVITPPITSYNPSYPFTKPFIGVYLPPIYNRYLVPTHIAPAGFLSLVFSRGIPVLFRIFPGRVKRRPFPRPASFATTCSVMSPPLTCRNMLLRAEKFFTVYPPWKELSHLKMGVSQNRNILFQRVYFQGLC